MEEECVPLDIARGAAASGRYAYVYRQAYVYKQAYAHMYAILYIQQRNTRIGRHARICILHPYTLHSYTPHPK